MKIARSLPVKIQNSKLITVFAAWLFCTAAAAQVRMMHDTVPFEIIHNKFIVQAKIDGKAVKFILDTGGINTIMFDSAVYHGIQVVRTQTIADVNDAVIPVVVGSATNLRIGRWMNWDTGKLTVVPDNPFLQELGVVGTLGGEFFSHVCLSIDRRNRRITISHPYRPSGISRNAGTQMQTGNSFHAVAPVTVGGERINVLFDTGKSGFLTLSAGDYARLNAANLAEKQHAGHGMLFVGISGIEHAASDSVFKVRIPALTLPGGKELHNVGSLVGQQSATMFGQKLFDYGVVMLDYPRGMMYFFPYEDGPDDVAEASAVWNARIIPSADRFEVAATIGDVDLRIGDRVWNVNGTELTADNLSESYLIRLLEETGNRTAVIMVGEDRNSLRKVIIKKI